MMDMPAPFKNFLHTRCATTSYSEGHTCKRQTAKVVGDWIFQDLLCQWGAISEIISDNGTPFVKALNYLAKRYHINHICMSGYNLQANGIVERPHFHVCDTLFKSCAGEPTQWAQYVPYVLWADRITMQRRMGVSPYFVVTGTHPILPFGIAEATYLMPQPTELISMAQLIANWAVVLQQRSTQLAKLQGSVFDTRVQAARIYECEHTKTM